MDNENRNDFPCSRLSRARDHRPIPESVFLFSAVPYNNNLERVIFEFSQMTFVQEGEDFLFAALGSLAQGEAETHVVHLTPWRHVGQECRQGCRKQTSLF